MRESGDTQRLRSAEVAFRSPFAGQLRESHAEGGGGFGALSPLGAHPPPTQYLKRSILLPAGTLRLPLRCPVLDDLAERQNMLLLCPCSYRVPQGQETSD